MEIALPQGGEKRLAPIGTLFKDTFALYRNRFLTFMAVIAPPIMLGAGGLFVQGNRLATVITIIVTTAVNLLAYIALIVAVRGGDAATSYRESTRIFFPYLWVAILVNLITVGGMVMALIPAIVFSIWFIFGQFIFFDSSARGMEVLLRSKEYVRGLWWPVFLRFVLLGILIALVMIVIAFGFELGAQTEAPGSAASPAEVIVISILQFFFISFIITYLWVIYQNLKAIKPELAGAPVNERGKGFFIFSAVLGVVAPLLLLTALVIGFVSFVAKNPCLLYDIKNEPCPASLQEPLSLGDELLPQTDALEVF
ncbi:MAG: hypothetical protein AAB518_02360 [Patescibacteria group bacterium]